MRAFTPARRRNLRTCLTIGVLASLAFTVTVIPMLGIPAAGAAVLPTGFKNVGYMPSWAGSVDTIQYSKLTHINYAFVMPGPDGSLPDVQNPPKLQSWPRRTADGRGRLGRGHRRGRAACGIRVRRLPEHHVV